MKKGYCHIDGKVCTIILLEDQREFVEHFQSGKQIGKILDMKTGKNVTGPQNTFYWVWNLKNLETRFQILIF